MRPDLIIETGQLTLAPLMPDAADGPYAGWVRDSEVTRFTELRHAAPGREELRGFIEKCLRDPDSLLLGMFLKDQGSRHVGNIKLGPINRSHSLAAIGLLLGAKDCWGRGLATESIRALAAHAFGPLGLHKLVAGVYANNPASVRAFEKAGFVLEGRYRRHYLCDGEWVDSLFLGRLNDDPVPE